MRNSLGEYCAKQGIALIGGDIKSMPFTTLTACEEECARTDGCVAFETSPTKCYIKNKEHAVEVASAASTSVRMSCTKGECF